MAGHVSRSPETLLNAYRCLTMVTDALSAVDAEPPMVCATHATASPPCCAFFAMAMAGWHCSMAGRKTIRA